MVRQTLWLIPVTILAFADDVIAAEALTLPQAAALLLERNPLIEAAPWRRAEAEAGVAEAQLDPQWFLSLEVEDVLGSGIYRGFEGSESTLRLSRIFQHSETREGRVEVASVRGTSLEVDLEADRLELLTQLARDFVEVIRLQESLALSSDSVTVWESATELSIARERAGAAPAVDRLRSEMRVANARLALAGASHDLEAARFQLASNWSGTAEEFGEASGELCALATLPGFEQLAQRADASPVIQKIVNEERLADAEQRLAEARGRPDWILGVGLRHSEVVGDQALVFGATLPLGAAARTAPSVARARAQQRSLDLGRQDRTQRLRATLFRLYQEFQHTRDAVELLEDDILPRAQTLRDDIQEGYAVGRFSHAEFTVAQAELLAARFARINACADHQNVLIEIEHLTGGDPALLADGVSQ